MGELAQGGVKAGVWQHHAAVGQGGFAQHGGHVARGQRVAECLDIVERHHAGRAGDVDDAPDLSR
jgi:hypothetical protein